MKTFLTTESLQLDKNITTSDSEIRKENNSLKKKLREVERECDIWKEKCKSLQKKVETLTELNIKLQETYLLGKYVVIYKLKAIL